MIHKFAQHVSLSSEISDEELQMAQESVAKFLHLKNFVQKCSDHLDVLYNPFREAQEVPTDETIKNRRNLRTFRDTAKENFAKLNLDGLECYKTLVNFSTDTKIRELMDSFVDLLESIDSSVEDFNNIFSNLQANDFKDQIVKGIENIKKQCAQLINLINDRILEHINSNILGHDWLKAISEKNKVTIEQRVPNIIKLRQERMNAVDKAASLNRK